MKKLTANPVRGFTLIELIVSLGLGIAILTVTTALTAQAVEMRNRARIKMQLTREAAFAAAAMTLDVRQAGLGLPWQESVDTGEEHYGGVIAGTSTGVGIIADLPRPDAQYNVIGPTASLAAGDLKHVAWYNENNGVCVPDDDGNTCDTADHSIFFPGVTGCVGSGFNANDQRTCPWGLRRLVASERLQIVNGKGQWTVNQVTAAGPETEQVGAAGFDDFSMLKLNADWPVAFGDNNATNTLPFGKGAGFVTTLDRVFYFQSGTSLMRRQCWGDPDPVGDANWPDAATSWPADPSSVANNTCTGEEVIARNVESFSLTYRDGSGTVVVLPLDSEVKKSSVRSVEYELRLKKTLNSGTTISHTVRGMVSLKNMD